MIEVVSKIQIYEIDGEETNIRKQESLTIQSHWNYHDLIVIRYGDKSLTVNKEDLMKAVVNAGNW